MDDATFAEFYKKTDELRGEYTSDADAYGALALIVCHIAGTHPYVVIDAFDWFNEE